MSTSFFDRIKVPHVFTLLTGVIFLGTLLTYIIPSGTYQRETKEIGGTTRTIVIPGSYQQTDKHLSLKGVILGEEVEGKTTPASLHNFLTAIPRGLEQAADIIFFIFIIGGVFGILQRAGTINAVIHKLLEKFGHSGVALTIILMSVFALGGSTLGMGEEFIPLVPIILLVSKELGYDRIYGLAMVMLAADVGFAAATTNPFNVIVAQGISELPLYSGMWLRLIFFLVILAVTVTFVVRYGRKIKKDPSASIMADDKFELEGQKIEQQEFTKSHIWIVLICGAIFVFILYAVQTQGWWMADMGGGFFLMGIVATIISRISVAEATKSFVKGMEGMVVAALVVGFARGIQVVFTDGQILDTIIYAAATTLSHVPLAIAAQGMLVFQTCLNLLIPSGSGQAAVTMPIMAPISDVIGLTRQTAVFAFQCGDGFSNMIIPTSGILMAMLSLAKIPYQKWLKFVLPLFILLMVLSAIFLTFAVLINYQ